MLWLLLLALTGAGEAPPGGPASPNMTCWRVGTYPS
jgi:hypothetical protein